MLLGMIGSPLFVGRTSLEKTKISPVLESEWAENPGFGVGALLSAGGQLVRVRGGSAPRTRAPGRAK